MVSFKATITPWHLLISAFSLCPASLLIFQLGRDDKGHRIHPLIWCLNCSRGTNGRAEELAVPWQVTSLGHPFCLWMLLTALKSLSFLISFALALLHLRGIYKRVPTLLKTTALQVFIRLHGAFFVMSRLNILCHSIISDMTSFRVSLDSSHFLPVVHMLS